jgi:hypothetical protein
MNIENFEPLKGITIKDVFEKQKELEFLYEPKAKEVFDNFDIDCLSDQEEFKKYCWRITEELCEALEAYDKNEEEHINEELLDGFNFFIELLAMYGWNADDISVDQTPMTFDFKRDTMETIQWIGLAANCLKNREWRQSQYLVDLYVFEQRLRKAFNLYLNLLRTRLTDDEILDCWSLKYQVNLFRIKTKY